MGNQKSKTKPRNLDIKQIMCLEHCKKKIDTAKGKYQKRVKFNRYIPVYLKEIR